VNFLGIFIGRGNYGGFLIFDRVKCLFVLLYREERGSFNDWELNFILLAKYYNRKARFYQCAIFLIFSPEKPS